MLCVWRTSDEALAEPSIDGVTLVSKLSRCLGPAHVWSIDDGACNKKGTTELPCRYGDLHPRYFFRCRRRCILYCVPDGKLLRDLHGLHGLRHRVREGLRLVHLVLFSSRAICAQVDMLVSDATHHRHVETAALYVEFDPRGPFSVQSLRTLRRHCLDILFTEVFSERG